MVPLDTRARVVDDEPLILSTIGQALRLAVLRVNEETSARRAIDLFTEHRHPVVVLDLMMPEMSGIEMLEQIHRLEPRTRDRPPLRGRPVGLRRARARTGRSAAPGSS